MKNLLILTIALALGTIGISQKANAAPTFIGSFMVDGGGAAPSWTTNPPVYSGQEAAALLFGGLPSDYFISVDPSLDPLSITHTAHYDGWAEPDTIFGESFHFDTGGGGYNSAPGVGSAWSAYVYDHADTNVNYVWLNDQRANPCDQGALTPEPCSLALLGLGGIPLAIRRRKNQPRYAI